MSSRRAVWPGCASHTSFWHWGRARPVLIVLGPCIPLRPTPPHHHHHPSSFLPPPSISMNHTRYWFKDELLSILLPWSSKDKLARISKDEKLVCFRNWIGNTGHQLVPAGILSPCGELALGQSLLLVDRAESSEGQRPPMTMTWQVTEPAGSLHFLFGELVTC